MLYKINLNAGKAIEDIQLGDMVLAYDEKTGEQAYKEVVRLFRNESKDWTGVTVNGTEIISTTGHKYYLPKKKEWVAAAELKKGTKVLLSDGTYGIITKVRSIHYNEPQTTYNFEVEGFHTYYVGTGVLVHNMNGQNCLKNYWPDNDGFEGKPERKVLEPGTIIDRYGNPTGRYASPVGTPFKMRALPPEYLEKTLHTYKVVKPIEVSTGKIASAFNQLGGGIQYFFDDPIIKYLGDSLIEII